MTEKVLKSKLETVDRVLMLLECFTDAKPEWGISELSEHLGLYKSVIHRMLSNLQYRGYVSQNPVTKKYSLGLKLFELGMIVSRQMNLRAIAGSEMKALSEITEETVLLTIVDGSNGVCIEKMESNQAIKSTSQLGKRVPLYAGAPTKLLMAYLSESEIDSMLQEDLSSFTDRTITDPERLKLELLEIRKQGYCWTFGELDIGSAGIAFPIYNAEEQVIASVSVLGPEFRMKDKMEEYHRYCGQAAQAISKKLGARADSFPLSLR